MSKLKVSAIVRMTIEIPLRQGWDEKCTTDQVHKQAVEDAQSLLRQRKLVFDGIVQGSGVITQSHPIKIIDSKVKTIIAEEE